MNYQEKYLKYANSKGISLEQVFYKKYLLYNLDKNLNPSLNIYKSKYLKYKNKYITLKKQMGGELNGCVPDLQASNPQAKYEELDFIMTPYADRVDGVDLIYNQFMETLDNINSNQEISKVLILKIGSSTIADANSTHYFRPDKHKFTELLNSNVKKIYIIAIDPDKPSSSSINHLIPANKLDKVETFKFKGYFPLGPGSEKANEILHKMINLKVSKLIILNEMGSGCYNSFRAIMHNRESTHYFVNVNNHNSALNCGNNMYGHKGTYNRCKRENPRKYTKEWINLKTLTTDGDETEPLDDHEKLQQLGENQKITVTFIGPTKRSEIVVPSYTTLKEIQTIYNDKEGIKVNSFAIRGKSLDVDENENIKLNELTNSNEITMAYRIRY